MKTCDKCNGQNGHHAMWCPEGQSLMGSAPTSELDFGPEMISMPLERVAAAAHEVNRIFCQHLGDYSQSTWDEAPDWQKKSAITGVLMHRDNPQATPKDSHESWLKEKIEDGWKWGPEKDSEKKTHPCLLKYEDLPAEQKIKDSFFCAVVKTLLGHKN